MRAATRGTSTYAHVGLLGLKRFKSPNTLDVFAPSVERERVARSVPKLDGVH